MDKLTDIKKRVVQLCYPFFLIPFSILILNHTIALADESVAINLQEVRNIANTGAASLALHIIDEHQKSLDTTKDQPIWIEWETERISIYESGQRWQVLQQRVAGYDENLPADFYYWAKQKQIDALLKQNKGYAARQILQSLIWSDKKLPENNISEPQDETQSHWLSIWQKKIIMSYLADNETADALLAAQRYFQDYNSNDIDDRLLRARILLMNQREEEVVELLAKDTKHPQGGMLFLLAQLRSASRSSRKVYQSALRQMRGKWASDELRYMLWAVAAEAAKLSEDRPSSVNALEFVLAGNKKANLPAGLFNFNADTLWNAYIDYAFYLGNLAQYLIGNDQPWLDAAEKTKKKYPVRARSLYAMVMLRGQSESARLTAAKGFLALMHKRKRGAEIVIQLFLKSQYFKTIDLIPVPVRYDLVDIALSRSDIELASNLMTTIQIPPTGADNFQWQLRRARIFILGGKIENGTKSLISLIENDKIFNQPQLDQFLQVVFDLQTVNGHEEAYKLFATILPKIENAALQREIYFWMADSRKAQHQYEAAARLYLHSAQHLDITGLDPWGQTARYQAADMLAKANLLEDAHSLFEELLQVTKEPARRAVLNHELQKLWLLKNKSSLLNPDDSKVDLDRFSQK